jgi:phage terminase large subunit-like protein
MTTRYKRRMRNQFRDSCQQGVKETTQPWNEMTPEDFSFRGMSKRQRTNLEAQDDRIARLCQEFLDADELGEIIMIGDADAYLGTKIVEITAEEISELRRKAAIRELGFSEYSISIPLIPVV